MDIEFYDVKLKKKVSIPEKDVTKTKFTSGSGRTTYGLRGKTTDGRTVTKFIGKADWDKLKVPEAK
jgi:hypothetical protein